MINNNTNTTLEALQARRKILSLEIARTSHKLDELNEERKAIESGIEYHKFLEKGETHEK